MSGTGATILGVEGLSLTDDETAFLKEARPFGFILFARNVDSPEQVTALCSELRHTVGYDAPILIDQEGGRVQRLRGPVWREWLPPLEQVELAGNRAEEAMYARYRIIADELRTVGVDANCAPLVDVAGSHTHPFLKNRCYGTDVDTVAKVGRAVANAHLAGGVLPVVKHIPGHGRAAVDSHTDLPVVDVDLDTLVKTDFAPFRALNDLPMGMTAHLVYTACDARPATISKDMMTVIRNQIGFDGLIMTDDISMKALKGSLRTLSEQAIAAGCDVVLHCNGNLDEAQEVTAAAGTLDGIALDRAERALAARQAPREVDIPALEAKLAELLNGRGNV
ncbi:MAG: beta-N-acetylhexosaminidase [Pseudomonadota bacterium]